MIDLAVVDLSRLQFALTALYHFLFVPLTLGLSFLLVIMESIYVMTRRPIWRTIQSLMHPRRPENMTRPLLGSPRHMSSCSSGCSLPDRCGCSA